MTRHTLCTTIEKDVDMRDMTFYRERLGCAIVQLDVLQLFFLALFALTHDQDSPSN